MNHDPYAEFETTHDLSMPQNENVFQQAVKTSYGQRRGPMTNKPKVAFENANKMAPPPTGLRGSLQSRLKTGRAPEEDAPRPITAITAAGYNSTPPKAGPAGFRASNPEVQLEESPEAVIRKMEKEIMDLIDESCFALERKEHKLALEKANKAVTKEKILQRHRDIQGFTEQNNYDLTYSVYFNAGNVFEASEMYQEAQAAYTTIIKNKAFSNAGRLRVNLGNILLKQGKNIEAVRMYRRALDQIPETYAQMRVNILKNIAKSFIGMNPPQYADAVVSLEHIMKTKPEFQTAFTLILCYYAIGDQERMKRSFQRMLSIPIEGIEDDDRYLQLGEDPHSAVVLDAIKEDSLRKIERSVRRNTEKHIIQATKLISPMIESNEASGFDWCVECVRNSPHSQISNELEINKALVYLQKHQFKKAVETLLVFEKKKGKIASTAANNLSFLYFTKGNMKGASKFADEAIEMDSYNHHALVNRGNVYYKEGSYSKAKDYYEEALAVDSSCTEAQYNLGLTFKSLGDVNRALECFEKLHTILNNSPEVIFQIGTLYYANEMPQQCIDWFMHLVTITPTDPGLLATIGEIHEHEGDRPQAYQYIMEAHKYLPSEIGPISWLGSYYIEAHYYEKAIEYFKKAVLIEPNEVKWQLMIASCHRRSGNYPQSLATYKRIHKNFPENVECLRFLVRICSDLGLNEAEEYEEKLILAKKTEDLRQQRREMSADRRSKHSGGSERSQPSSRKSSGRQVSGKPRRGREPSEDEVSEGDEMVGEKPPVPPKVPSVRRPIDTSYEDPIGDMPVRPRTAARPKADDDDFFNAELDDDLLPM